MIQSAAHLAISDDARVERKRSRAVLPCTPAEEAALSLVRASVDAMATAINTLREAGVKDAEAVHQARVATRRAEAALLTFRGVIDEASERRIRRRLNEIRRCAGEIRKCDVHAELLTALLDSAGADERLVIGAMVKRLDRRRRRATKDFRPLLRGRALRRLERAATRVALHPGRKGGELLEDVAQRALPVRAADMDVLCRTPAPTAEELHDLRIAGKRARYVLEVVGLCVDAEVFNSVYRRMEQFQELLGHYNDDHELLALLDKSVLRRRKLAKRSGLNEDAVDAALDSLRRAVSGRCSQRRATFLAWWGSEDARVMISTLMGVGQQPLASMLIEAAPDIGGVGRHIAC